jgi:hypothetical protein
MTTESKLRASGNTQLVRPRYSAGLMLQDDDLTQAVDYARELNRLMFRSMLGCGVVCGLKVTLQKKGNCTAIHIAPGLALTGCGDPIHVSTEQIIPLDHACEEVADKLWVVIRRTDYFCMPRDLACSSDEDAGDTVYTRLRDGFEILLEKGETARKGACGCTKPKDEKDAPKAQKECYQQHTKGECECDCSSEWVVLGLVDKISSSTEGQRDADHSVRRFVGPMIMLDPALPVKPQGTPTQPVVKKPDPEMEAARKQARDELTKVIEQQDQLLEEDAKIREELADASADETKVKQLEQNLNDVTVQLQEQVMRVSKAAKALLNFDDSQKPS